MILTLSHIYKDYDEGGMIVSVLKDINLSVDEGEYVSIMGPSGSGKSTLMNIIGCLDVPTKGDYTFDGKDIMACSDDDLAEVRCHGIGFIFQSFQLLSGETALENVMLPLSFSGVPYKDRAAIATRALERVGLGDRVGFLPNQLSGGQKQRVAIARALVNNPKVILADEPTGALDQASGAAVMELFDKLNSEGVTIIMITHDAGVASRATRKVSIIDGRMVEGDFAEAMKRFREMADRTEGEVEHEG